MPAVWLLLGAWAGSFVALFFFMLCARPEGPITLRGDDYHGGILAHGDCLNCGRAVELRQSDTDESADWRHAGSVTLSRWCRTTEAQPAPGWKTTQET